MPILLNFSKIRVAIQLLKLEGLGFHIKICALLKTELAVAHTRATMKDSPRGTQSGNLIQLIG